MCTGPGTVQHRHWACKLLGEHREQLSAGLRSQGQCAAAEGGRDFWKNLLLPHSLAAYPRQSAGEELTWHAEGQHMGFFTGNVYI